MRAEMLNLFSSNSFGSSRSALGLGALSVLLISASNPTKLSSVAVLIEPPVVSGPTVMRRLSATEYARSIKQVFGDQIEVAGRFEPPLRDSGLLAIGNAKAN